MDAANILKPALSRGEIKIIGATTRDEYRKHIEKDAALERRFQPISVEEPDIETAVEILKGLKTHFEKFHNVKITDEAILSAVTLSSKYVTDRYLPDKAIDCLDETCSRIKLSDYKIGPETAGIQARMDELVAEKEKCLKRSDAEGMKAAMEEEKELKIKLYQYNGVLRTRRPKVSSEDIANVISGWTGIPLSKLSQTENEQLLKLEKNLHKRVIGQNEAIEAVAKAIRRGRVGIKDPNRPIGSFLFLGPTGVGKTELCKALAENMFGKESSIIRVDMSEYMEKHSVSKMIGSPPGYVGHEEGGQLSEQVRQKPYSIVLFDEIEKAHPDVFNVLLQVLDEGTITDSQGRHVSFKNTIIIMTSNAGAQAIVNPKKLGFSKDNDAKADYEKMKSGVMEEVKRIFKPEFINRIDDIIVFHELTKDEIANIVKLMLNKLSDRVKNSQGISIKFSSSVIDFIAKKGYDPKYGARPLKRAIQDVIEDEIADEVLRGKIKSGMEVSATMEEDKLLLKPNKKKK
jgi:ATP-dependent Clp protease ATP-binding subunit ClpC